MNDSNLIEYLNNNREAFEDYKLIIEDENYINTLSQLEIGTILKYINKKTFQVQSNSYVKLHPNYDLELYNKKRKWEVHIYANKHYIFYNTSIEKSKKTYTKKDKLKTALQDLLNSNFKIKIKKIKE
jgi:hypothetical protein